MTFLALDIGNTRLKWAQYASPRPNAPLLAQGAEFLENIEKLADGAWRVRQYSGDPSRTLALARSTLDWVGEAQQRGAGEIVLNCMGSDGVRRGYDIAQLAAVRAACDLPLVASGGAGEMAHFASAFLEADVDAALAASVFHDGSVGLRPLKRYLRDQGLEMRDDA